MIGYGGFRIGRRVQGMTIGFPVPDGLIVTSSVCSDIGLFLLSELTFNP
jgi:hypothetical protein